ncbi:sulfurtransferase [Ideonella sp. A 288]|uniref:sulfurtransferase n=1 Tax=Ideonella sp. A 288 TaxID=1962181 RepID=UPI000B4B86FC|nr:sulfurtransferase [Ideonella sp. A 288]
MNSPLISTTELQHLLRERGDRVLIVDAGFDLADPSAGERAHAQARLPGAVYLHLDRDLSAPRTGRNGRHPLPDREAFAARLAAIGAGPASTVVAYDASGGMYAARLWWMLRWVGHADVQVLDGGLAAWRAAGGELVQGVAEARAPGRLQALAPLVIAVDHDKLRAALGQGWPLIVDARATDRFRGENETLDPVGGRIPGAVNRFFRDNLAADGRFKPAGQLRDEWQAVLGGRAAADVVQQCGSGVTACHNLLALEVAGLGSSVLYPGSWSEWCAQPGAPVAVG